MPDLDLTYAEVAMLAVLAAESDPDPRKTDASLMAVYYKARAAVTQEGNRYTFKGSISVRRGS